MLLFNLNSPLLNQTISAHMLVLVLFYFFSFIQFYSVNMLHILTPSCTCQCTADASCFVNNQSSGLSLCVGECFVLAFYTMQNKTDRFGCACCTSEWTTVCIDYNGAVVYFSSNKTWSLQLLLLLLRHQREALLIHENVRSIAVQENCIW